MKVGNMQSKVATTFSPGSRTLTSISSVSSFTLDARPAGLGGIFLSSF